MSNSTFMIGCDPEVFVTKRGKPASALGLIEGTKEQPHKTKGGAYQVDGMAAEFNTDPLPFAEHQYSWNNSRAFEVWNKAVLNQLDILRQKLKETGHTLKIQATMEFGQEFLDKQPDEAKELGCDPDYSAYTKKHNPRPDGEQTFRTGAGHIHIGWGADIPVTNEEHITICSDFVKMLDAYIGVFMTYIDRDPKRRVLYGKAGAFRPKPYGVEYRTPSNRWLETRDTRYTIWRLLQDAITVHKRGNAPFGVLDYVTRQQSFQDAPNRDALLALPNSQRIPAIIDNGWWKEAELLLDQVFKYESNSFWKRIKARAEKEYADAGEN